MNILVFDIETVPDVETGRCLYDLEGLNDKDIVNVMQSIRYQETEGRNDFIRHHLQRVIAISVVLRTSNKIAVWSLGEADAPEAELLQRFFEGIERYSPLLVSWNGHGFDLPVLHYRSLLHGISAPRYWESGEHDSSFRWNNYLNRYHERHTDLMDVLAGFEMRAYAPLDEIATMLGFPGKMGMSGADVWDRYCAGEIDAIRQYCETDVLNTYLVYLRYELLRGRQTKQGYDAACQSLRETLTQDNKPHLLEFLSHWKT